jgi:hypothetical protein
VAKDLDLHFFDVIGFNLYPVWPPEVVAIGFDRYIQEVLQPIAGNKPLLISEFGANSLEAKEADQARLVLQCWNGLLKSGACGGIVFEFADEWWKNYDNPRRAGNWWDRKAAPEDEKSHDQDPEEYYGVFKADRQPKSASSVVRQMFTSAREQSTQPNRVISGSSVLLLILIALGSWIWAKRRVRVQLQVRDR